MNNKNKKRPGAGTTGLNLNKSACILQENKIKDNYFSKLIRRAYPGYTNSQLLRIKQLHNQYIEYFDCKMENIFYRLEKRARLEEGSLKCL